MEHTDNHTPESVEAAPQGVQAIQHTLQLPIQDEEVASLRAGDWVLVSGTLHILGSRAIHHLSEEGNQSLEYPFAHETESIFFAETIEAPLGQVIGSIAPISVERHAMFCCALLDAGVRCIVGSGPLTVEGLERLKKKRGLYLVTVSGAGALLARSVHQAEVVACEELGAEAVRRIKVSQLPCMIALDGFGRYLL